MTSITFLRITCVILAHRFIINHFLAISYNAVGNKEKASEYAQKCINLVEEYAVNEWLKNKIYEMKKQNIFKL